MASPAFSLTPSREQEMPAAPIESREITVEYFAGRKLPLLLRTSSALNEEKTYATDPQDVN